ncbi:hypothetical protein, partial [Paraburkholderia sabiae]|uniref:hypothetical protein n=1 Tax=Paraburkholderia sabiae TaxID=273251 RepID=UPI003F499FB0
RLKHGYEFADASAAKSKKQKAKSKKQKAKSKKQKAKSKNPHCTATTLVATLRVAFNPIPP